MESRNALDPYRPGILAAAVSPTALSNLLCSVLLLVSPLFPHSLDTELSTIGLLHHRVAAGSGALADAVVLWPYQLAMWTFLVTLALIILRPWWFDRALLAIPTIAASMVITQLLLLLFSDADMSRTVMSIAAVVAPIAAGVGGRMLWLWRAGDWVAAATWGQSTLCVLGVFSLRWFWFYPVTVLHWGGVLSIISLLLLMLASWTWVSRARHDFRDRSSAPIRFQISLRQIIVAVTAVAVSLAYWQAFSRWAN